jgi:2-dehydropantoate 2-reductase
VKVVVLGAGVQGTLYGVRLAMRGHSVALIARGRRAAELRQQGAVIEHALSGQRQVLSLPVSEELDPNAQADLCLVTVRREQLMDALPSLREARGVARAVFMVNHACGSEALFAALGRERTVLAFPGAAGGIESGVDRYLEIPEQPTIVEAPAADVAGMFRDAGFRVTAERDVDSWLRRHAVFVTAVVGALYEAGVDTRRLSKDGSLVRVFVGAVREGSASLHLPSPYAPSFVGSPRRSRCGTGSASSPRHAGSTTSRGTLDTRRKKWPRWRRMSVRSYLGPRCRIGGG